MTAENLVKLLQMTQLHDLLCLINLLRAPTCERLEAMWRDYVQSQPAETTEPFKQFGMRIEPELTAALAAGRRAFERLRYWHEEHEFVFYLGALPTMLFTVAFKIRPDWAEPCQAGRATCAWVASIGNKRATAISRLGTQLGSVLALRAIAAPSAY